MASMKNAELLKDERVIKEIERHKWLESEKAEKDIGFDQAAQDWLNRFSETWKSKNLSQAKKSTRSAKRFAL
jgi:hypothetical protein